MAVVQISRIQIRRGQALQGSGLPQLASGEMAWAIDTQELYIGNGAVSEGAPAVGNTKLLTENDLSAKGNLLALLQYVYKVNDPSIITGTDVNNPVSRSIQDRMDDRVSTVEFGAAGNGTTDDTTALQRAINELFLNPNGKASSPSFTSARIPLEIPAGIYLTKKPLYVPSYSTLIGAGNDKTIIYYNPVSTIIGTTDSTETITTTSPLDESMVGAFITGTNIPDGTTIQSVSNGELEMSDRATGSGIGTTFTITLSGPAIQFIDDTSTVGNPSFATTLGVNQPKNIHIKGLTIETPTGQNACLGLYSVKDSLFENIKLQGKWPDDLSQNPSTLSVAIQMNAFAGYTAEIPDGVTCQNNIFKNITFSKFYYAVYAKQDIVNNVFDTCTINNAIQAFALGFESPTLTNPSGPRETIITNTKFYNVKQQAVFVNRGFGNAVKGCKFYNVGSDGGGYAEVVYPEIFFNVRGNSATENYSTRSVLGTGTRTTAYVPELAGYGEYHSFGTKLVPIGQTVSPTFAFRLPCATGYDGFPSGVITYVVNYSYVSNQDFSRRGTITISADITNARIQLTDEYDFAGEDPGNTISVLLSFKASYDDQIGAPYIGSVGQEPSSIVVSYENNLEGDVGEFDYSYTAIS
jgi:hypothetical protein